MYLLFSTQVALTLPGHKQTLLGHKQTLPVLWNFLMNYTTIAQSAHAEI